MVYFREVLLIVLLVVDCASVTGAGSVPMKMIVAYASISPRVAPLWVAQEQGFFKKNGIEAELIFVRGAPTLVAALTSGDMDIGYTGGTAVLGASAAGIDLKILAVLTNRVTYDLVTRPDIKRVEDLRVNVSVSPASAAHSGWAPCWGWNGWVSTPTAMIFAFS
jgi:ABC-type nitrate/sulfonate/bicarbonate transport system substrate-binding protein